MLGSTLPILAGPTTASAASPSTTTTTTTSTTTAPGTTPADAAVVAQASKQVNAPLPALPAVDRTYTEGVDPAVLLARAFNLLQAGTKSAALDQSLSGLQASVVADIFQANQAKQQAAAADADAIRQAVLAQQQTASAASLNTSLRNATLSMYMTGRASALPVSHVGSTDAFIDAVIGEQLALSPSGMLAARKRAASEATAAASKAAASKAVADAQAAQEAASQGAATDQATAMQAELASLDSATAKSLLTESSTLSQQAGHDLTTGTSLDFTPQTAIPAPVATTEAALTWAFSELGKPYVWGGTGPDVFDCSGLTQFSWAHAGVGIPRVAIDQYNYTVPVPLSQLRPGDLVFFGSDVHHVGMYIGGGLMINAPHTGTVVQIEPMWWSDLIGFGRVHAVGVPVPAHSTANGSPLAVIGTLGDVPSQTGASPSTVTGTSTSTTTPSDKTVATTPSTVTSSTTTPGSTTTTTTPTTTPGSTSSTTTSTTSTTNPGLFG